MSNSGLPRDLNNESLLAGALEAGLNQREAERALLLRHELGVLANQGFSQTAALSELIRRATIPLSNETQPSQQPLSLASISSPLSESLNVNLPQNDPPTSSSSRSTTDISKTSNSSSPQLGQLVQLAKPSSENIVLEKLEKVEKKEQEKDLISELGDNLKALTPKAAGTEKRRFHFALKTQSHKKMRPSLNVPGSNSITSSATVVKTEGSRSS